MTLILRIIFRSDHINITNMNHCFSTFLVSSNPLLRKYWEEPQALEYRINRETYTPYAGAAGILLHINGKFTMGSSRYHMSLTYNVYLFPFSVNFHYLSIKLTINVRVSFSHLSINKVSRKHRNHKLNKGLDNW